MNPSDKSRIVRNSLSNYAGRFLSTLVTFLAFPVILLRLGPDAAVWGIIASILAYAGILYYGLGVSIVKNAAECGEDASRLASIAWTSLILNLSCTVVVSVLLVFAALFCLTPLGLTGESAAVGRRALLAIAAVLPVSALRAVYLELLRGLQRWDLSNAIEVVIAIVEAGGSILLLLAGYGLVELVVYEQLISILPAVLGWAAMKRIRPGFRLLAGRWDTKLARSMCGFSGENFLYGVLGLVIFQTDRFVISILLTISLIPHYLAVQKLYWYVINLPLLMLPNVLPAAAELYARGEHERLRKLWRRGTKYSILLFLPLGFFTIIYAAPLLDAWVGGDYGTCGPVLAVFVAHYFCNIHHMAGIMIVRGLGRMKMLNVIVGAIAVVNLLLSILLARPLGLMGVVLGTSLPFILFEPWLFGWICRELGEKPLRFLGDMARCCYPAGIVAGVTMLALTCAFPPHGWPLILLHAAVAFFIYAAAVAAFAVEPIERAELRALVARLL